MVSDPIFYVRLFAAASILESMKNPLMRHSIVLSLIPGMFLFLGLFSDALSAETCPPVLAGLMPKDAVKVTGSYMPSGMISMGSAAADLPFSNPCSNQTTKYPGRITLEVQHYTGDGVAMFKMQVDACGAAGAGKQKG